MFRVCVILVATLCLALAACDSPRDPKAPRMRAAPAEVRTDAELTVQRWMLTNAEGKLKFESWETRKMAPEMRDTYFKVYGDTLRENRFPFDPKQDIYVVRLVFRTTGGTAPITSFGRTRKDGPVYTTVAQDTLCTVHKGEVMHSQQNTAGDNWTILPRR